jgi:small nuclear ribonucleoprotein (snRNP)-like protein
MRLTDGLIHCLEDSLNKKVEVTFKERINKTISGQLIGFDSCIILLNSLQNQDSEPSDNPIFIDLDSVCMITVNEGDIQGYGKAFENFRLDYAKNQKRLKATDATETT